MHKISLLSFAAWVAIGGALFPDRLYSAEPAATLTILADQPGPAISPTMWGIFFEDINFGGDGGLYAELVKNRSFEFPDSLMGWSAIKGTNDAGSIAVRNEAPCSAANPHYLRLKANSGGRGFGVSNEGFRGIGVREGSDYRFSVSARRITDEPMTLKVELVAPDDRILGTATLNRFGKKWTNLTCTLRAIATEPKARLNLRLERAGTLDLDMVSLFPQATWKNRSNGLRADVVQLLADLKPGFMRFPGGCIVEGHDLTNRYQWKTTIGDPAERRLIMNRWNDEFKHRPTPDYYQSFGLGFYEYFLLCEDIGAEPLPIINCGMACQFNTGQLVPLDQLAPYIQDALDLIEFANGPATSTWGGKRAKMGHPQPFNLKLLGVGNEQWGPQYIERFERFAKALKAAHPEVRLVTSAGPDPDGEKFDFLWPKLRALNADIVDEHYYRPPAWFLENAHRYDTYARKGPKIFAGEYAAQSVATCSPENRNNWECALAEAAFMTGLERNADVVEMSSYAPLSGHVDAWQWRPNLIWFDNLRSYGTPNYYVQQMFSRNRGDRVLPVRCLEASATPAPLSRLYVTAARDDKAGEIILKVVNATPEPILSRVRIEGAGAVDSRGRSIVLSGASLTAENSLEAPRKVAPMAADITGVGPEFQDTFKPQSMTVLRLRAANR